MNFEVKPLSAGLYFVSTPIGSARDITLRALDVMASADVLASEDTRTTRKLMEIHGVPLNDRKLIAFHDHSGKGVIDRLVAQIVGGKSVAYFSEAGTPLVADPGYELGVAVANAGLNVTAAPGPSAVIAALTLSALPTDRFAFVGFLPNAKKQRETTIAELRDLPFTLIFYESPKRVCETLAIMCDVLGDARQAVICREMTKKFEEVSRGTLRELADNFASRTVKGEIVLVVGREGAVDVSDDDVIGALREALETMRVKDAATAVSGALGLPRKQVYQMALQMKDRE